MTLPSVQSDKVRAPVEKPTVRALSGTFTAAMGGIGLGSPALCPRAPLKRVHGQPYTLPTFFKWLGG